MIRMLVAAPQRSKASGLQVINVSLANRQRARAVDLRLLRRIVHTLLSELLAVEPAELGIYLVAAPAMTRLNETFVRHAGSTDVITFDYSSHDSDSPLHGEIFVCLDEAIAQARHFRTTWQSELVRYIVHGVLHLRGFDDRHAAARRRMKREENRLLSLLAKKFHIAALAYGSLRARKS